MITWIVIFSVIGLGKFVNLKGLMELLEIDLCIPNGFRKWLKF
jgi:hypothetical protein